MHYDFNKLGPKQKKLLEKESKENGENWKIQKRIYETLGVVTPTELPKEEDL